MVNQRTEKSVYYLKIKNFETHMEKEGVRSIRRTRERLKDQVDKVLQKWD